jgi:hypothetical protein
VAVVSDSLEEWLAASLSGHVVSKYELPTETDLHQVHAQLARGVREQRRFKCVEMTQEVPSNDTTG